MPCTYYSSVQNMTRLTASRVRRLNVKRRETRQILRGTCRIMRTVVRRGGHVYFEWPLRCQGWKLRTLVKFQSWLRTRGVAFKYARFDGCMYGLRTLCGHRAIKKEWKILTTDVEMEGRTCSQSHRRAVLHAQATGRKQVAATAYYPDEMVKEIAQRWQ